MKVAIFGLLLFPPLLHLYSLWLLLQLTSISASVSPHKRFKLFATLVLDVAMLFGGMCIWPMCLAPARYW
jgi:hypothetical protein